MGGAVRVVGQEDHGPRLGIGAIHTGVGTDEPMLRLGDDQVTTTSHDRTRHFLDELPLELLLVADHLPHRTFGLRDDLVGDHEHVPVDGPHGLDRRGEDGGDVVPR